MPINPSALGDPAPEEQPQSSPSSEEKAAIQAADEQQAAEPAKRTRRSKAQMIADAVVPADDEQVDLRDSGTGAKIQRPWLVALELVRDGKAEFADKAMKYSMQKYDQQKAAPAFEQPATVSGEIHRPTLAEAASGGHETLIPSTSIPPKAEVGDEVCVGADVFRVGHGRVLTKSPVSVDGEIVHAKQRWQRGPDDEWRSSAAPEKVAVPAVPPETNGKGSEATVERERLPTEIEHVGGADWRVGTSILDKIGLPSRGGEWSSLQIGPLTANRSVTDDGRRTLITLNGVERAVPTASIEAFHEAAALVEYMGNFMRGELTTFLESQGVSLQPLVPA